MEKFEKVLVRHTEQECWKIDLFSHIEGKFYYCMTDYYSHCIPFEGNEELLNTAKVPEKIVPVMYKDVKLSNIQSIINQNIALLNSSSAVSCETYEQYLKVTSILEKLGFKWCTGKSYSELDHWDVYKEKTILFPGEGQYWNYVEGRHNLFSAEYFIAAFETAFGEGSKEYDIANKKHAVHCSTKELALKVLDIATSLGYDSWRSGESFKSNCRWEIEGNDTVYYLADRTRGYLHIAKDLPGHFVIEAEDFIKKYRKPVNISVDEYDISKENCGVLCSSEEEAIKVLKVASQNGYCNWCDGDKFVDTADWEDERPVYYIAKGTHAKKVIAETRHSIMISGKDFIEKYQKMDSNLLVHCSTKEIAQTVLKIAQLNGKCRKTPNWVFNQYENNTYIRMSEDGSWGTQTGPRLNAEDILIEAEDFIKKFEIQVILEETSSTINPKIGVSCKTHQEYIEVTSLLKRLGLIWSSGKSYSALDVWDVYQENTMLVPSNGTYGNITKNEPYTIVSSEYFLSYAAKIYDNTGVTTKVYFIGSSCNGPKNIAKLESLGAVNSQGYEGRSSDLLYFIIDGEIICTYNDDSKDLIKMIKSKYTKL